MVTREVFGENDLELNCLFNTTSIEQLKAILDAVPSSVVIVNSEGKFLYVNKRGMELYGADYTGFEMEKHSSSLKVLRLDGSPFPFEDKPVIHSIKSGQVVRNVEMIIENAKGIRYTVNVSTSPLYDNHGKIYGAVVIFDDFTALKEAEKEIIKSKERLAQNAEEKYRMLFNSIDQGFFITDVIFDENDKPIDMYYVEANYAATKILGRNCEGMRLREISPNYEDYWFEIFGKVALTGQSVRMEQYAEPDKKWYSFYVFKIGDEKSRRVGNIFIDVTKRKLDEVALQESEKRALDLVEKLILQDQNKNALINMLSHELRNPLASIMMSLDLLDKVPTGGKQAAMALEIAKRQGKLLTHLVDDLLDVTRITQNKIALKKENVELNELIIKAVQDYQSQFIDNGVKIEVKLTLLIYIEADPSRLTQVIGNLLHNAAKFTSNNDLVVVTVSQDTNTSEAVITIQDTGIGIDPRVLGNLFEPFMQVDKSLDRSYGGLGLGLAIVKGMVELHGGRVEAFSEGLGKGAKFTIRLPLTN